jgi:hypothetical protein
MSTVKRLRELIADKPDDEKVFFVFYEKSEADEWLEETMETTPLTNDEWSNIVEKLGVDEGLWDEVIQSWNWYIEKALNERVKANGNSE